MPTNDRVTCSTITLRHLPLREALATIARLGFTAVDLGALPGVCDHVPFDLTPTHLDSVESIVRNSGLRVDSINGDIGDLNTAIGDQHRRGQVEHARRLLDLASRLGAQALVLPNGAQDHRPKAGLEKDLDLVASRIEELLESARTRGVEIWIEAPHHFRLAFDLERTSLLVERLPEEVGLVLDVSHVVASGGTPKDFLERFAGRTRHVHLRDAEPGYIHHSIERGRVDFAGLMTDLVAHDYTGRLALELETRDVEDVHRPQEALRAAELISALLEGAEVARRVGETDGDSAQTAKSSNKC